MDYLNKTQVRSIEDVSDIQWREAMKTTAKVLTIILKDRTQTGAFAERVLGIPAVEYFSRLAFDKLYTGHRSFRPDLPLSTQMIGIARSEISNHLDQFNRKPHPELDSFDDSLADNLLDEKYTLDVTYEQAERIVSDDPELVKYLAAMRQCTKYKEIASELDVDIKEVYNLQRRLIRKLNNAKEQRMLSNRSA